MYRSNLKALVSALAIANVAILAGCGGAQDGTGTVPGVPLPGAPITNIPGLPAGVNCVPITGPIPFSGTGVYFDSANIVGGNIPYSYNYQSKGQMVLGGGGSGAFNAQSYDGQITMSVTSQTQTGQFPYPGYPNQSYCGGTNGGCFPSGNGGYTGPSLASVAGTITISPAVQQEINNAMAWGFAGMSVNPGVPYQPGVPQTQACVSAIAIDLGHYHDQIYGGVVYLYLNGTQRGAKLYFH